MIIIKYFNFKSIHNHYSTFSQLLENVDTKHTTFNQKVVIKKEPLWVLQSLVETFHIFMFLYFW